MQAPHSTRRLTDVIVAALAATSLGACAADGGDVREPEVLGLRQNIISGDKIDKKTIDELGLVQVDVGGDACSGVLIGPRRVLTARHCEPDVGTRVSFLGTEYETVETFEPGSELDTPWGPRDLEILVLDRDVVSPSTGQQWQLTAELREMDLETQVGADFVCYGVGPNELIDGKPSGNDANEYYGAIRTVTQIEDGVAYRIEPGTEPGDSGGPCFPLLSGSSDILLVSINSTAVHEVLPDDSSGRGTSAALTATGEAGAHAWILSNM